MLSIGDEAFYECENLSSVVFPESLATIGERVFWNCEGLNVLTLPDTILNIGEDAFIFCDNLTLTVSQNSFAEEYCKTNKLDYIYPESLDWLTN